MKVRLVSIWRGVIVKFLEQASRRAESAGDALAKRRIKRYPNILRNDGFRTTTAVHLFGDEDKPDIGLALVLRRLLDRIGIQPRRAMHTLVAVLDVASIEQVALVHSDLEASFVARSEEHTSELQSRQYL